MEKMLMFFNLMFFNCEACMDAFPYEVRHRAFVVELVVDLETLEPVEGGRACFLCPSCYEKLSAGEKVEDVEEVPAVGGTDAEDD